MASMATLQSNLASLIVSSSSFLGQRFSSSHLLPTGSLSRENNRVTLFRRLRDGKGKNASPTAYQFYPKMHVNVGDTVKVISGNDKGRVGEVLRVIRHNSTIIVDNINLKTKHVKSKGEDEPVHMIKIEAPIHSSNVMLYAKETDAVSTVGHKTLENGKRVRYLLKTGEIIDGAEQFQKRKLKEKKKEVEVVATPATTS